MKSFKYKKDIYSRNRGGKSYLLEIKCAHCDSLICFYQKDGAGELKRLYRDRIISSATDLNDHDLSCSECGRLLAVSMIYEKEERAALRLFVGAIKKRKITLNEFENTCITRSSSEGKTMCNFVKYARKK